MVLFGSALSQSLESAQEEVEPNFDESLEFNNFSNDFTDENYLENNDFIEENYLV